MKTREPSSDGAESTARSRADIGNAAKWSGIGTALSAAIQLAHFAILSRLLGPTDIGIVSMGLVVIGIARTLEDLGFGAAVIQREELPRRVLSTLQWTNVLIGFGLCAVIAGGAPLIAAAFDEPRLLGPVRWMALSLPIAAAGELYRKLLERNLRFRSVAFSEAASIATGFIVAMVSVRRGEGVYSLVWGQLATAGTRTTLLIVSGSPLFRPSLHWSPRDLKGLFGFGGYQLGERGLTWLASNADQILIGRFAGAEALGIYSLAHRLVMLPISYLNPTINRVAFPVLARHQQATAVVRDGFLKIIRLLAFLQFPMLLGLAAVAPLFVPVVFGKAWCPATGFIRILVVVAMLRVVLNPSGVVFLSLGRVDVGFRWNVLVASLNVTAFFVAIQFYGARGVAWSHAAVMALYLPLLYWLVGSLIDMRVRDAVRVLVRPLLWASAMALFVLLIKSLLWPFDLETATKLAILVTTGAVFYFMLLMAYELPFLRWLSGFVGRRGTPNPEQPPLPHVE